MRAIVADGPDTLIWREVPDPVAGPGELLVRVAAAGVNRADLLQAAGHYPPPPGASDILGLEVSGTVAALGPHVTSFAVGDQVCALLAGGGYAELVAVPTGQALAPPDGASLEDAAALPEVAATVWSNLVLTAELSAGELVLLHGGGSGVGSHAIQVAKALGSRVAVTAGSVEKLADCRDLGADLAINYRDEDFVAVMQAAGGADVILDIMGAAYLDRNLDALAVGGRLVVIGLQGGATAQLSLGKLLAKRARVIGANVRSRPTDGPSGKALIMAEVAAHVWPMVADGRVRPIVGARLPIAEAAAAHALLRSGQVTGKILLTV
ncbi:MAG: NAD(P)H-quinone oxidoreductase [Pseudomonas sp.]